MRRCFYLLIVCSTLFGMARAQGFAGGALPPRAAPVRSPAPDPKKEAERVQRQAILADAAVTDAAGLRVGENRAYVFARSGALSWKSDQKNASSLFQRAINEIANALTSTETEVRKKQNQQNIEMRIDQQVRPGVLNIIANFDPEMALDGMYRTRSAAVQRALMTDPSGKVSDTSGANTALARSETTLEQHLMMMAADKNPETAIKMLQDSLKKGVSSESLSLLRKLYAKDPQSATSFASDIMSQLIGASFSNDPADTDNISIAAQILNDSLRDRKPGAKEFSFDASQLRSLAQKFVNFILTQDYRMNPGRFNQAMPIAEKYSPGSVSALRRIQANSVPASARASVDPDARRIMSDPKMSAAEMAQQAKNVSSDLRPSIYQSAASKYAQTGDINSAIQLLNANFSGTALEQAIAAANSIYVSYLIGQGKFSEAEQLIDSFPEANKKQAYIQLATRAYAKSAEDNKAFAISVLGKVRGLLPARPEDNDDMNQFMQLVNAYAAIDADEAFDTYEPLVPQLNEVADAQAVVQSFQNSAQVRSGEFVIGTGFGYYGFSLDASVFRSLAKADFDRTQKLIDSFSRRELRIALRLQLAESGLQ